MLAEKQMRITDRYQNLMDRPGAAGARPVDKAAHESTQARAAAGAAKTAKAGAAIQVNVSARAQELAAGAARLEELKASIKDGSFKVDADAIAAKLVGDE
jgi:anti-sigma28 factor (negative regulator of flagellin synthesis)